MTRIRVNDRPDDGTYVSRARQAIEEGITANDEVGDKQSGDGLVQIPMEGLQRGLNIVRELKENISMEGQSIDKLAELEKTLEDMIKD